MPKVLPEYLRQRRKQVLDAAAACFSRNGFHQTSMQDICREAHLSPGAVYRYFRSKEEIIQAICEDSHEHDLRIIEAIRAGGQTLDVLAEIAREFFGNFRQEEISLVLDLWAESGHDARIHETVKRGADGFRTSFAELVRRAQARGEINPRLEPEAVARIFCSLYLGCLVQRHLDPDFSVEDYVAAAMAMAGGTFWEGSTRAEPLLGSVAVH